MDRFKAYIVALELTLIVISILVLNFQAIQDQQDEQLNIPDISYYPDLEKVTEIGYTHPPGWQQVCRGSRAFPGYWVHRCET